MKKENELKDLLDRLKGEVARSSVPAAPAMPDELSVRPGGGPAAHPPGPPALQRAARPERFVPVRPEPQRSGKAPDMERVNFAWSENKEAMLFGVLASLMAVFGGILSGLEYVILIGAVTFMLFSFMMVLALFGHYLNFRAKRPETGALSEKVEQLSQRLDSLAAKGVSRQPQAVEAERPRDRELEGKVEELRTLVKALAKAVDRPDGGGA